MVRAIAHDNGVCYFNSAWILFESRQVRRTRRGFGYIFRRCRYRRRSSSLSPPPSSSSSSPAFLVFVLVVFVAFVVLVVFVLSVSHNSPTSRHEHGANVGVQPSLRATCLRHPRLPSRSRQSPRPLPHTAGLPTQPHTYSPGFAAR